MPPVDLTDAQIAQLQSIGILPTPEAPAPAADTTADPAASAPAEAPSTSSSAPAAIAVRDLVVQETTAGWMHTPITRYGLVIQVDDTPAVTGTDAEGADVHQLHATVAWLGGDVTAVAVDELTAIG